jgi:chromatin remodeling complex protein RSC6
VLRVSNFEFSVNFPSVIRALHLFGFMIEQLGQLESRCEFLRTISQSKGDIPVAKKANAAFMKPLQPSSALSEIVGSKPLPRTQVVKKLWDYIKKNDLQDKKNRRNINADVKLKPIFGKSQVSMFEMTKLVSKHLS